MTVLLRTCLPAGRKPRPTKQSFIHALVVVCFICGCQTASVKKAPDSPEDIEAALKSVTQGVTNAPVSEEDLKRLARDMQKDPQARSAIKAVQSSFNAHEVGIKYCPKDGSRYSSRVKFCPLCGTELKSIDQE